MAKQLVKSDGYKTLVTKIREELEGLELLVKTSTVTTYWRVGRDISEHLLENKDRADYGDHFFEELAEDIGRDKATLWRTVQFYRAYPILAHVRELPWRSYLGLLTVKDDTMRKQLENKAIKDGWTSEELLEQIKVLRLKEKQSKQREIIPQLAFIRGRLSTYRLLEPEILPSGQKSGILIDLGFRMRRELIESDGFKPNDFVSVAQKGKSYSFEKILISDEELFTYVARVQKVIDADTLWTLIDAGFGRLIQQKLRLRGIDCPELSTPEGQRAKRFVQERLRNFDIIVIKSYKDTVDKYDRYLVDLFYLSGEKDPQKVLEQGTFLNQELLSAKLAVQV